MEARVLLIRPLCEGDEPEFAEPLGIERLAGYLRAHGVPEVGVFDRRLYQRERRAGLGVGSFWDDVRDWAASGAPDVVGISLMTESDVPDALRVLSRAHAWWPQARLAAGGLFVTTAAAGAARRLPAGVTLLAGEGEATLLALVAGGTTGEGAVLTPDDWAPAYRPFVERYAALGCAVNIQTSRGCPGACAFCATPRLPAGLRRWQPRSLSLVANEIAREARRLETAGLPPVFNFVDDDFGPLERAEALADELARRRLRVAFALEMRLASLVGQPDLATRLARLHAAGLTRVFVGVESLDLQTLRRWHKPHDVTALPGVLAAFATAGVSLQCGYILWHGHQTVAGARSEAARLRELGIYSHRAALSRLIVFEGCALARECDERGLQRMDPAAESFYQRLSQATEKLTRTWTQAAIDEPYAAAKAYLSGDDTRLVALRATLHEVNEQSFERFMREAEAQ